MVDFLNNSGSPVTNLLVKLDEVFLERKITLYLKVKHKRMKIVISILPYCKHLVQEVDGLNFPESLRMVQWYTGREYRTVKSLRSVAKPKYTNRIQSKRQERQHVKTIMVD